MTGSRSRPGKMAFPASSTRLRISPSLLKNDSRSETKEISPARTRSLSGVSAAAAGGAGAASPAEGAEGNSSEVSAMNGASTGSRTGFKASRLSPFSLKR